MRVYSFTVAWICGLAITVTHIATAVYLWFSFVHHKDYVEEIYAPELVVPLTVTYMVSLTKWFFSTKGIRQSDTEYGLPTVVFTFIIVTAFLVSLPLGPYLYANDSPAFHDPENLNRWYLFVESVLGGSFAYLFSELFATREEAPVEASGKTE